MIPHFSYDLGYISFGGFFDTAETVYVKAIINYAVNVMLLDYENYDKFCNDESYEYYGGYAKKSPSYIKIPHKGKWMVVVDNGGDDMDGIDVSIYTHEHEKE